MQESKQKQESLQVQVKKIQGGWGEYYASALTAIKSRFEQINSSKFLAFMEKQKSEGDKLDQELAAITGDVSQLEMDVQSTVSTQGS